MVALIASLLATLACLGIAVAVGKRRKPGTPITWGEAFVAATFIFFAFVLAYGIVPHQFLAAADNEWKWRPDNFGIPLGPFATLGPLDLKNPAFSDGITFFGRGRVLVSAQTIRDIIVSGIYVGMVAAHLLTWTWWQKRDKRPVPELTTSPYGRPLIRGSKPSEA